MREGEGWLKRELSSLRILGRWGSRSIRRHGNGIMCMWARNDVRSWNHGGRQKPGDFSLVLCRLLRSNPGQLHCLFLASVPKVLREDGAECDADEVGFLAIANPWPGMLRGFWNDPDRKRFKETYFTAFPGYYLTGEGAKKDEDGYCWLMGRIDGVINVSGHPIGTAEVESALVSHPSVAEAAVIGIPHEVKGQGTLCVCHFENRDEEQ